MRRTFFAWLFVLPVLPAAAAPPETIAKLTDGTEIGAPVSHGQLTVFPLLTKAGVVEKDYMVLDEGMDKGYVAIKEKNDEQVAELHLTNKGNKPLFVMAGEIIVGGKQDRIISKDVVIPPNQQVAIPVRCVEHGRWAGVQRGFSSAKAMAHTKLRTTANYDGQGEVWKEVADKNVKRGKANATDTYRRVATETDVKAAIKGYQDVIGAGMAKAAEGGRMVGFAVAVNGKIVAVEQFGSPKLFGKLRDKLLQSYYVEAIDVPKAANAVAAKPADVRTFDADMEAAPPTTVMESPAMKNERTKGPGKAGTKVKARGEKGEEMDVYKSTYAH
jgi:hypothetical protein